MRPLEILTRDERGRASTGQGTGSSSRRLYVLWRRFCFVQLCVVLRDGATQSIVVAPISVLRLACNLSASFWCEPPSFSRTFPRAASAASRQTLSMVLARCLLLAAALGSALAWISPPLPPPFAGGRIHRSRIIVMGKGDGKQRRPKQTPVPPTPPPAAPSSPSAGRVTSDSQISVRKQIAYVKAYERAAAKAARPAPKARVKFRKEKSGSSPSQQADEREKIDLNLTGLPRLFVDGCAARLRLEVFESNCVTRFRVPADRARSLRHRTPLLPIRAQTISSASGLGSTSHSKRVTSRRRARCSWTTSRTSPSADSTSQSSSTPMELSTTSARTGTTSLLAA